MQRCIGGGAADGSRWGDITRVCSVVAAAELEGGGGGGVLEGGVILRVTVKSDANRSSHV